METKSFMALQVLNALDAVDMFLIGGLLVLAVAPPRRRGSTTERWVRRRVAWLRRATAAGALAGLFLGAWFGGLVMFSEAVFTRVIAGPLLIAGLARAGAAVLQSGRGTGAVANLRPRTLQRYLDRRVRVATLAAAGSVVAPIIVRAVLPEAGPPLPGGWTIVWQPTRGGYVVLGLLALCAGAAIEAAAVAVARRSHPAGSSAALESLEYLRRRTVNSVSLFGAAGLFTTAAGLTSGLATYSGAPPAVWAFTAAAWVLLAAGVAAVVAGLVWCPRPSAHHAEGVVACS